MTRTVGSPVAIVYNGVCARRGGRYFHSESFAVLLRELSAEFGRVQYFGFFLDEGDPGLEHTCEAPLGGANLELHVVRGNTSRTGSWAFCRNYVAALWRLGQFLPGTSQIVVFVPSFLSVAAALAAVALRKQVGLYIGGNWSEETQHRQLSPIQRVFYPVNRYAVDPLVRWIARRARFVITPGYDSYTRLRSQVRRILLPAPLLRVTRNDIVTRRDTCSGPEIRVLFVGALRVAKGVIDLVEAFARVRERISGKRVILQLVGSGEAEPELRERVAKLTLGHSVQLLGHVPNGSDLFALYRNADVFALPTYSEGFPRSLYEAMTFAVPIVTTSVGGIPHLLEHGRHALLVRPGSRRALEDSMFSLCTDSGLRSRLIEHGRQLMRDVVYPRIERDESLAKQIRREFDLPRESKELVA